MFAYDLNEPDILQILLQLAKQGRVRIILDDATLHHNTSKPTPEDKFADLFNKAATKGAAITRGHFGRYAHDKIFIVSNKTGAIKVLTGSTNFSVTGMYVNSNHILVFNDPAVAAKYAEVFEASWTGGVNAAAFAGSALAAAPFAFKSKLTPPTTITFSPHTSPVAGTVLQSLVDRINVESKQKGNGSVLFAVMDDSKGHRAPFFHRRSIRSVQSEGWDIRFTTSLWSADSIVPMRSSIVDRQTWRWAGKQRMETT